MTWLDALKTESEHQIRLLRFICLAVAILYLAFGMLFHHVLEAEDLLPLTHRLFFAGAFLLVVLMSYSTSIGHQYIGVFTYILGVGAVLNVVYMGGIGRLDSGAIVALLMVIPVLNFLFYRWRFLLAANSCLLVIIVASFTMAASSVMETLLLAIGTLVISGISFRATQIFMDRETELEESQQRYRDLVDNTPDFIYTLDRQGRHTAVNASVCKAIGLTKSEIIGKNHRQLGFPEDVVQEWEQLHKQVFTTGEKVETETTTLMPDGTVRICEVVLIPIVDHQEAVTGLRGTSKDITDRKRAEEEIRQSEEKFRQIAETMGEVFWLRNAENTEMIYINPAYETVWGRTCHSLYKNPNSFIESVYDEDKPLVFDAFEKYMETGGFDLEYRIERPSGELRWVRARSFPVRDNEGNTVRHTGSAIDITKRKQAEEALKDSEQRFRTLVSNVPDVIFRCNNDPDWTMEVISDTIEDITGYPAPEFLHNQVRSYASIIHPEDRDRVYRTVHRHLLSQTSYDLDYRIITKEKTTRWIHERAEGIFDDEGDLLGIDGVISDVTERKQLEAELQEYTIQVEALYSELDFEIDKALTVHKRNLPIPLPQIEGIKLAGHYQPAKRMGGDYYNVILLENKLILYLSDVIGHGLDGAMMSLFVKKTIDSFIALTPEERITPAGITEFLFDQFQQESHPDDFFISFFTAVLNLDTWELAYKGAGFHTSPLVCQANQHIRLDSAGLPITSSIPKDLFDLEDKTITLVPGTTVLMQTDGMTEQAVNGTLYGDRLEEVFFKYCYLPPQSLNDILIEDFRRFNNGSAQGHDDITSLILQIPPEDQEEFSFTVPSTFEDLAAFEQQLPDLMPHDKRVDMMLPAIHEAGINAIEHGNKIDPKKHVIFRFALSEALALVEIEDQGDGFDWRSRKSQDMKLDLEDERGRGLTMMRLFCDQVLYNDQGNRVSLLHGRRHGW